MYIKKFRYDETDVDNDDHDDLLDNERRRHNGGFLK